jgi:hypothetical protein
MLFDNVLRATSLFRGRTCRFSSEQGIHPYLIDISRDQAAPAARKGQIRCDFAKFPVKFPASRELRPAKARETSEIFTASVEHRASGDGE